MIPAGLRRAGLTCVLVLGPAAWAQTGIIEGRVLEAGTRIPLALANVVLVEHDLGTATDADGRFRLTSVPPGRHSLRASFVGYRAEERPVHIEAGEVISIELALEPLELLEGDAITVEADRLRMVGRTGAPSRLVPQSVGVVTEATLRAQGAFDVEDALRNVPGIAVAAREQPYSTFTLRGFSADGTGTFRRNGVEVPHYSDGLRSNVTEVQVLRGPASVLYGRIEPGGVVNFVTRVARCDRPGRSARTATGLPATLRIEGTYTPPCTEGWPAVALDASLESRASHRSDVRQETAFVAATATLALPSATRITVDLEADASAADLDPGLPQAGAQIASTFDREPYFGEPAARYDWRAGFASLTAERWIGDGPLDRLTARISYGAYRHGRDLITLDSLSADFRVHRSMTAEVNVFRYLYAELSADGRFQTDGLVHEYVAGVEATRLAITVQGDAPLLRENGSFRFAGIDPVRLDDPEPTGLPAADEMVRYLSVAGAGVNFGAFVQNRTTVQTPLGVAHGLAAVRLAHVTAGAEWFALATTPDTPAGLNERSIAITAVSPSVALLLEPITGLSVHASWGTSFNPVFQQVDADGQPFEPTRGRQIEVGLKYEAPGLAGSLAAFSITKEGALSTSPDGFYVQTGEQRSRGIEVDLSGRITASLTILAALSLLDARVTSDEVVPIGHRLPAAPSLSGRAWLDYRFSATTRVAAGIQHVGERFGSLDNDLAVSAYTIFDAAVSYRWPQGIELGITATNLLDRQYVITAARRDASADGQALLVAWPGAPRSIVLRASFEF